VNITKMLVVALAAGTIAFGASALATPAPASAHTPEASATCTTLTVALTNYGLGAHGTLVNRVSVAIDSTVVEDTGFGASFGKSYPLGGSTVAHAYVVRIDASGTQYDRTFAGTSVPCAAPVVVVERPAAVQTATETTALDCDSRTRTTTTTTTTSHSVLDAATNAWVAAPSIVSTSVSTVPATAVDCPTTVATTTPPAAPSTPATQGTPAAPATPATPAVVSEPSSPAVVAVVDQPTPPAAPATPAGVAGRASDARVLASTGSDAGTVAPIGAAIFFTGLAILIARRLTAKLNARC
jgi:hypothetical protein